MNESTYNFYKMKDGFDSLNMMSVQKESDLQERRYAIFREACMVFSVERVVMEKLLLTIPRGGTLKMSKILLSL